MSYNIVFEPDKKDALKCRINFEGDFTVNDMEAVKKELLVKVKEYQSFVLMIEKVEEVDFTFFQIILAFYELCKKENKNMKFRKTKLSENVKNMINKLGFDRIILKD